MLASIQKHSACYKAAQLLYREGPMIRAVLCAKIHFGHKNDSRTKALNRAFESGWLEETVSGAIAITRAARLQLAADCVELPADQANNVAKHNDFNVKATPPLSKKYLTNSRGFRDDTPEWSVRSGISFQTQA